LFIAELKNITFRYIYLIFLQVRITLLLFAFLNERRNFPLIKFNLKYFSLRLQIVAVILCNTGIALLAYMDGITGSPTLGGVVLATAAAAGSAVYKVSV